MTNKSETNKNETVNFINSYIDSIKTLTTEEQLELFKKMANGDSSAREQLFAGNLKLVLSIIIKSPFNKYEDKDDLFQIGCIGLLKAIDGFDFNKGYKFSTYAFTTIKGTLLNYINDDNLLKINRKAKALIVKVNRYKDEFYKKNGREATQEEIAEHFSEDVSLINDVLNALSAIYIWETDINEYDDTPNGFDALVNKIQDYECKYSLFLVKTIDAHLDLISRLQIKDKFDHENELFKNRNFTKEANSSLESEIQNKIERDRLNENPINWIADWIIKVGEINPNRYYNRLIALLFPGSDFAENAGPDYSNLPRQTVMKRNALIRKAISENMRDSHGNQITRIEISTSSRTKNYNIENELTRDDRLFRVDDVRNIVFLIALALNLDYVALEELLMHCLGERKIDFKNPYEAMLSYCIIQERPSCEHYLELKKKYEAMGDSSANDVVEYDTVLYEDDFWGMDNDEDFMNYLKCLPKNNSQSARKVLQQTIDEIQAELLKDDVELYNMLDSYLNPDTDPSVKESLKKLLEVNDTGLVNVFINENFNIQREGIFKFLRRKVFNTENLDAVLSGNKIVTKEYLLVALFFRYCLSDRYAKLKKNLEKDDSSKSVKKLYYSFKGYANPLLEKAGFDFVYLPALFESFLMYCLVSDKPLETFKQIMMYAE